MSDTHAESAAGSAPERISFLLLPEFAMMAFMSAVEPLRVANRLGGKDLFRWQILSPDGHPVTASNGMKVVADAAAPDIERVSTLFICASFEPERHCDQNLRLWLRRMAAYGAVLGAIDTGSFLLARAGLLDGYRVTMHWESRAAFREAFPTIHATQELFEIDGNRLTCAGGTAAMDMMLHMIGRRHSQELAVDVSEQFIRERIRERSDHQRMALRARLGIHNPHILRVVALMEKNIETPLRIAELAAQTGVSTRQLERLFTQHLHDTPQGYYLKLRLAHARRLLQQTSMHVISIALACGFGSAAPLSRAYKAHFGRTPRQDRRLSFE